MASRLDGPGNGPARLERGIRSVAARYSVALLSIVAALVVRAMLTPLVGPERFPLTTLFVAIVVASWYGGFGPAFLTLVLGVLTEAWFFMAPRFSFFIESAHDRVELGSLALLGLLIVALDEARRTAKRRATVSATQASQSREAFEDSEARARAVLDTVNTGIVSIDERGCILSFNRAAERMFGHAAEEVVGQNVRILMPSPQREEHDQYLASYLRTHVGKIIGIGREVVGRRKDGSIFPLDLAVNDTVLRGKHLFTAVLRDLTDQKAAEERQRAMERRAQQRERLADIGAVTARIVHDLGNPLAGLSMTARRILRSVTRTPQVALESVRDAVDAIVTTTHQLDVLIAGFKDFAREQRLDLQEVRLPALLQEIGTLWKPEAAARRITFTIETPPEMPPIRADADKLRRVFENLVRNALEAVDRGPGLVRIETTFPAPERVRIAVEDTGPGVPGGLDVFALFETTKAAGTGLGLPICKQIVQAHGGDIEFAARQPRGTVFYVDLLLEGPREPWQVRRAGSSRSY